jgi:hypothetical protein
MVGQTSALAYTSIHNLQTTTNEAQYTTYVQHQTPELTKDLLPHSHISLSRS